MPKARCRTLRAVQWQRTSGGLMHALLLKVSRAGFGRLGRSRLALFGQQSGDDPSNLLYCTDNTYQTEPGNFVVA